MICCTHDKETHRRRRNGCPLGRHDDSVNRPDDRNRHPRSCRGFAHRNHDRMRQPPCIRSVRGGRPAFVFRRAKPRRGRVFRVHFGLVPDYKTPSRKKTAENRTVHHKSPAVLRGHSRNRGAYVLRVRLAMGKRNRPAVCGYNHNRRRTDFHNLRHGSNAGGNVLPQGNPSEDISVINCLYLSALTGLGKANLIFISTNSKKPDLWSAFSTAHL